METLFTLAVLAAFGYFIYTRIKASRNRPKGSGSGGGGGGNPADDGRNTELK